MTAKDSSGDPARSAPVVRIGLGIAWMLAGAFCLSTQDAVAKWLSQDYGIAQIIVARGLVGLPLILVLIRATQGWGALRMRRPWLTLLRGLLMAGSAFFFIAGLRHLSLASAWAVAFTAPLMMTALSPVMLGETVGWRRWSGVLVGFLGVLVVVRPGLGAFQPASLYILATAVCYALNFVLARKQAADETAQVSVFYITLVQLVIALPFAVLHWQAPAGSLDAGLFVLAGLLGVAAMLFLTEAFRVAPAAVVAPFDYSAMIWAVLWGWVIWRDWPDAATWAGSALIVGAGLYVLHRETVNARRARRSGRPPV